MLYCDTQAQQCDRNAVLLYSSAVWSPEYILCQKRLSDAVEDYG